MRKTLATALFILVVFFGSGAVHATTYSDYLVVYSPDGSVYQEVGVAPGQEDPMQIYYLNVPGLVDPAQMLHFTVLLGEGQFVSAIYGVAKVGDEYFLGFSTHSGTTPAFNYQYSNPFVQNAIQYVETNSGPWPATLYLNSVLRDAGYTAAFYADVAAVPLPASILLLASGFVGAVVLRRRYSD